MVFSSFVFLFRFLPATLLVYYILPLCARHFWLLISSIFFYAWGEPKYVVLLILSIIMNYLFGIVIGHYNDQNRKRAADIVMTSAVCVNVLLLCVFKYSFMLVQLFEQIRSFHIDFAEIIMPAGISFYTFQSISYLADVCRRDVKPQKNIISFGMYIAMFPQLIAGPVVRYKSIESQINKPHHDRNRNKVEKKRVSTSLFGKGQNEESNADLKRIIGNLSYGIGRFIIGLSKKVILANNIGVIWNQVSGMEDTEISAIMAWVGIAAFAFQIYFDFSGYSDMAIGLAAMFGFRLEENFNYPYLAQSITEFWRRWHISIGTWFREYVYIPLGGNRKGRWRHIFNILLVWTLTGLWHGANYNFLLWGLYFGILILLEKYWLLRALDKLPRILRHIYSIVLILLGWVIFEQNSIGDVGSYWKALFGGNGWGISSDMTLYLIYTGVFFFIILMIASTPLPVRLWLKVKQIMMKRKNGIYIFTLIKNIGYIALVIVSIAYLVEESYNPFLYFRF